MQIWTLIVQSNTFNFIVLILLLALILKLIKIDDKFQNAIDNIKRTINQSKNVFEKSVEDLKSASESASNTEYEIDLIKQKGDNNILNFEQENTKELEKQIDLINSNTQKELNSKESELISKLSQNTIRASIELAKLHITKLLEKNPSYHEKFINDSISELNRLK